MRLIRNCLVCGKEFSIAPSKVKDGGGKYCSHKCSGKINYNCKGYIPTPEVKQKISLIAKKRGFGKWFIGRKPWNYGKRYSTKEFKKCLNCGKLVKPILNNKGEKEYRKTCSRKCLKEYLHITLSIAASGKPKPWIQKEKNKRWNGGKKNSNGYIMIIQPSGKYRGEHDLVIEKDIGRKLKPHEVVHHINGNRGDNRIENLFLMTRKEHSKLHKTQMV